MEKLFSILLGLMGTGLLVIVIVVWDQAVTQAWRTGGVTSIFFMIFVMIIIAGISFLLSLYYWRKGRRR